MADTPSDSARPGTADDTPPPVRSAVAKADSILKEEIGPDPALPYQVEWSYIERPDGFVLQLMLSCLGWHTLWRRPLADFRDDAMIRRSLRDAIDNLLRHTSEELGKDIRQRLAALASTPEGEE